MVVALVWLAALATVQATSEESTLEIAAQANPIRKVVGMLQMMQKKVIAEGKKEEKIHDEFMCYCERNTGKLGGSIAAAQGKTPHFEAGINEGKSQKAQLQEELKVHRADRDAAEAAMASATDIRKKEAAAFAAKKAQDETNVAALEKAIPALTKGMAGSFLQTAEAQVLRNLVNDQSVADIDRQAVLSFLSGSQGAGYAPQGGEINGILKQIKSDITASLKEATFHEENHIKVYESLMAAKRKEVETLTTAIEEKLERSASLGMKIVALEDDRADTAASLAEDQKFAEDLTNNCKDHQAQWDERVKTRSEELAALADTIKILNDDDALELFKKTLPSASVAFVQVAAKTKALRGRALNMVQVAQKTSIRPELDFIAMALQGKSAGFEKVVKMIDSMVATMKTEQEDDDAKRKRCNDEFDTTEDKKKDIDHAIKDVRTLIEGADEDISTLEGEIAALGDGIKALDESVAEATEQRNAEHIEFTELIASDSAAKELLNYAKNRLHKFYNAGMHKAAPKRELSAHGRIASNLGGEHLVAPAPEAGGIANTGISAFVQVHAVEAPPPPPETFGAFTKKSEETSGVIAMMDLLIKDLDKEMQEAHVEEELAQQDFEKLISNSKAKKAQDTKTLNEKKSTKAALEADLERYAEEKQAKTNELKATNKYLASLHDECDWLLQNFDARKEARNSEIDALGKAKDVLNGASYEA